ncbi:twin-arginine translocase subunit TatC [Virgibacillus alimentarius]|uniref:Sec-independent protein translocase protein TatC n=1 Tax=Virgibacillus alimentarius TaxID=698769 RepID=A0ABS4S7D4_9BACI|nr:MULTISPECIES: twin-arginine translocase subunit TatC [Virgibacillus]MBP2256327.1 sec-independent protein translocase protein TatC [Virgibacillus alimentarius]HLR66273.1 twin-arginine translocase subunit TatC [Virgibacillus sp.]
MAARKIDQEKEMHVTGHISELRNRLIITAILFVLLFIIGFVFVKDIYGFFVNDLEFELNVTSPGDIIWVYFTMAGLIAIVGTLPILSLQIWLFIKPGLTPTERKASLSYIPAIFFLFIGGLAFGYFIFIELILPFLLSLNDGMFNELFTVDKYFRFLIRITLPFAVLFEIPIIAMFLTSLGIITPDFMKKTRKYAYFILVIIGAVVTPPDVILQIVVAIPLFILYEISIYLSAIVYRKKQRKHKEFMENDEFQ